MPPSFVSLPTHNILRMNLTRAWTRGTATLVHGDFGVGKTFGVRHVLPAVAAAMAPVPSPGVNVPGLPQDRWGGHAFSPETSSKAVLFGMYARLARVNAGLNRFKSYAEAQLAQRVVAECKHLRLRVLVLDEVQELRSPQITAVLNLADLARDEGWSLGLVLIGNSASLGLIAATKQLGQRIETKHEMLPLRQPDVAMILPQLAPSLLSLAIGAVASATAAEVRAGRVSPWEDLCARVLAHSGGAWRPLEALCAEVETLVGKGFSPASAMEAALQTTLSPRHGAPSHG